MENEKRWEEEGEEVDFAGTLVRLLSLFKQRKMTSQVAVWEVPVMEGYSWGNSKQQSEWSLL